jgi:hypothetical protein
MTGHLPTAWGGKGIYATALNEWAFARSQGWRQRGLPEPAMSSPSASEGFLEEVDGADHGEKKGDAEADRQQDRLLIERQGDGETHRREDRQGER